MKAKLFLLLALLVTLSACSHGATDEPPLPLGYIMQGLANNLSNGVFAKAVVNAGLVDYLNGQGPFTVFVPEDEVILTYLENQGLTEKAFLADLKLDAFVKRHIVEVELTGETLLQSNGASFSTLAGTRLTITVEGEQVFINDARITSYVGPLPDTSQPKRINNGELHYIDAMLALP